MANTISLAGISPGSIIEADQLTRVIYALNGVSGSDIIISGSLGVTSSAEFSSSVTFFVGATGSLFGTSSWALNALTASYFSGVTNVFPYTGSAIFSGSILATGSVNITGSLFVNGVQIGAGFNVIANPGPGRVILSDGTPTSATASANLIFTGNNFFITGSTIFTAVSGETNIVTVKSSSVNYLTIDTGSLFDIYSSIFNVRDLVTQQPVLTVSESIVKIATQSLDPTGTAPNGAIWFTSASLYVGLD